MIRVTQDLRDEHETIERVMEILEKLICRDEMLWWDLNKTQKEVVYFLRIFIDRCHHGKEEKILFPAMILEGTPSVEALIRAMLDDHAKERKLVNSMDRASKSKETLKFNLAAASYLELLGRHMEIENHILFEIADQLIPENKRELLIMQYDQHEEKVLGSGIHDKLQGLLGEWNGQLGEYEEDIFA